MKLSLIHFLIFLFIISLFHGCSPYTEGKAIQENLPTKYAFLVIDIQNDFMTPDGKLPIHTNQATRITGNINTLVSFFEQNETEIIYITNEFKKSDTIANWFRNNAAIEGSEGAKLFAGLHKKQNSISFPKSQPDTFSNNEFDQYLREKKITNVLVSGVFAGQCVLSTVKGAINRKYEVTLVSDALGAKTDKKLENALEKYKDLNVNVVTTEEILNSMKL